MIFNPRGQFVVLEGIDGAGKSSQCSKLAEKLKSVGVDVVVYTFPNRDTLIGKTIDQMLKEDKVEPHVITLLMSANRWEMFRKIKKDLMDKKTVICDRYAYSGIAYASAVNKINFFFAMNSERGLLKPDRVYLLDLPAEIALAKSNNKEIYDNLKDQQAARKAYVTMAERYKNLWLTIDGTQSSDTISEIIYSDLKKLPQQKSFKYI